MSVRRRELGPGRRASSSSRCCRSRRSIALAIGQLLAAGAARELAGNAAEAGAAALLQGGDPATAAPRRAPGLVARAHDRARGRAGASRSTCARATVVPVLAERLEASATADAGPP